MLEGLNRIDTVIFDKTGTLTEGRLVLRSILPLSELSADECLGLAAALENRSEHPIARAFGPAPQPVGLEAASEHATCASANRRSCAP